MESGRVLGERRGIPEGRQVLLDAVLQGELRAHGLDAVELDEAAVEAEAPRGGGVPVPAPAVVEHGVEGARGDLPRQRQRLVHLLRHLRPTATTTARTHHSSGLRLGA